MATYNEDGSFTAAHLRAMGKRLDQSIRLAKTTKAQVAAELGLSRAALTQYCNGDSTPTLSNMARICKLIKAPMDYIVHGEDTELVNSVRPIFESMLQELEKRR